MTNETDAHYHGLSGKRFWRRIAAIKSEPAHTLVYIAGCALQDHEQRMLQLLEEAEKSVVGQSAVTAASAD